MVVAQDQVMLRGVVVRNRTRNELDRMLGENQYTRRREVDRMEEGVGRHGEEVGKVFLCFLVCLVVTR